MRARGLQLLLNVMAIVMVVAGLFAVIFGAGSVQREGVLTPDVDTEFRFFAVWYVAAGAMLFRSARSMETAGWVVRWVGVAFFVAACARALSWIMVGRPPVQSIVLMAIEFVIALVVIPWQISLEKRTS